jgi:HicB-like protein involved in pilus formation
MADHGSNNEERTYSGQLRLRMPVTLHEQVAHAALAEGSSMNQFICGVLAGAVRWRHDPEARRRAQDEMVSDMWDRLLNP